MSEPFKVIVYPFRRGIAHGNIMWRLKFSMHHGKFPLAHPVGGGFSSIRGNAQCGDSPAMNAFRDRGYWASCFPEGNGITWEPLNNQDDERCLQDIRECFKWDVHPYGQIIQPPDRREGKE